MWLGRCSKGFFVVKRDFECIYLNYFPNKRLLNCTELEHFRYLFATLMTISDPKEVVGVYMEDGFVGTISSSW